jgi:hypothetical protein
MVVATDVNLPPVESGGVINMLGTSEVEYFASVAI